MFVRPMLIVAFVALTSGDLAAQVITGVVKDKDGNVIENARVTVSSNKGQSYGSAFTGSDGRYSIVIQNAVSNASYFVNVLAIVGEGEGSHRRGTANNVTLDSNNMLVLNFIPGGTVMANEIEAKFKSKINPPGTPGNNSCPSACDDHFRLFHRSRRCR